MTIFYVVFACCVLFPRDVTYDLILTFLFGRYFFVMHISFSFSAVVKFHSFNLFSTSRYQISEYIYSGALHDVVCVMISVLVVVVVVVAAAKFAVVAVVVGRRPWWWWWVFCRWSGVASIIFLDCDIHDIYSL